MLNVFYLRSQQSDVEILASAISNWDILGHHLKALS